MPYFLRGSRSGFSLGKERRSVQDDHPSLETLARWLAGELEHEQVRRELAPHFLEACPECRTLRDEIERLVQESGHWSESVAVVESREAPGLLGLLGEGSHAERMRQAEEINELHTWGGMPAPPEAGPGAGILRSHPGGRDGPTGRASVRTPGRRLPSRLGDGSAGPGPPLTSETPTGCSAS